MRRIARPRCGPSTSACRSSRRTLQCVARRIGSRSIRCSAICSRRTSNEHRRTAGRANGQEFIGSVQAYRRGMEGLAYEIVINSSPCIAYLMEENTMATQALVIAHACYGHNSFFKGNHLFRQWTDAESIIDYLVFARRFVMECEERKGAEAVEQVLDACHALMPHGVDRYRRPAPLTMKAETARLKAREEHRERS